MSNLVDFFARIQKCRTQVCIKDANNSYTYENLLSAIDSWEKRFDNWQILPGTVVGVRADYSISSVAALLALLRRKAVAALIPHSASPNQYLLDSFSIALLDIASEQNFGWHPIDCSHHHELLESLRLGNEGGIVLFTSGSTGRPKAVLHSVERFLAKFQRPGRSLCTLAFLLFDHIGGLDTLFYTLCNGGTLVLVRRRDPDSIFATIQTHGVEVLPSSPSFLRLACLAGSQLKYNLSTVKVITYGAEPMDATTLTRINALFPTAEIIQRYGTTETGSPSTRSRAKDSLWVSFNKNGVETKVVNEVLWIRNAGSMLGYLNSPTPIDEFGWYCTGDLVDLDGEWIRFRGRLTDLVNVGGEKVSPVEVEEVILELDLVRTAMVTGEPHPLMGKIIVAKVVLAQAGIDRKTAAQLIREHCNRRLARHKVPVKIAVVTEGFSNERQKVQRRNDV